MKNEKNELSRGKLLAFALPAMPLAGLYSPITVYLPPFYGIEMGVGLAAVGLIFMAARLWDILIDPLLGMLTDRYASRWGRRRHWLVASVPVLLLTVVMVFFPRSIVGAQTSAPYLLGWLMLLYAGYTIAILSQFSWAAELSGDYNERSRIMGWREIFHICGMLAVLGLPAGIELAYGTTSLGEKVETMGWFVIILLPLTVAIAVYAVPEYRDAEVQRFDWREAMAILARDRLFRRVLATDLMVGIPGGVMGALYVFFTTDIIQAPQWVSITLLGFFAAGLLGVPLTVRLSYRIGKHNAIICCSAVMLFLTLCFPLLGPGDLLPFTLLITLTGLIFNGLNVMLRAITADLVDHHRLEGRTPSTGLFYALLTLTSKLGYAAALLTYPLLEWLGYHGGGENSAAAIDALRWTFVTPPIFALIAGMAFMWRFPFGAAEQRDLQRRLDEAG